nr:hypothetical protein [Tanacetum cinerariifolium]
QAPNVTGKALGTLENAALIRQVAAHAHPRLFGVARKTEYHVGGAFLAEAALHQAQPVVRDRTAVGIGKQQPLVAGRLDAERKRVLLGRKAGRRVRHRYEPKAAGVVLRQLLGIKLGFVMAAVVDEY